MIGDDLVLYGRKVELSRRAASILSSCGGEGHHDFDYWYMTLRVYSCGGRLTLAPSTIKHLRANGFSARDIITLLRRK